MTVIDFDGARVAPFILRAVRRFLADPPDSDFQRGYLSALINIYREGLGRGDADVRILAAEKLT